MSNNYNATVKSSLAYRLRRLMFEKDWSQSDLAKKLETSKANISRWLKGVSPNDVTVFEKISNEADVYWLLTGKRKVEKLSLRAQGLLSIVFQFMRDRKPLSEIKEIVPDSEESINLALIELQEKGYINSMYDVSNSAALDSQVVLQ